VHAVRKRCQITEGRKSANTLDGLTAIVLDQ
jgi:hypothetical protein